MRPGVLLVVLLALTHPAAAPVLVAASGGWHALRVPGGTSALLTVAGLDPARPRASALLDIIRVIHEVDQGVDVSTDERRASVVSYLEALAAIERARAALPAGLSAATASNQGSREAVERYASALGLTLERDSGVYRLDAGTSSEARQRRADLASAGLDVSALAAAFNRGDVVSPSLPADELPLPLPEPMWAPRGAVGIPSGELFMQTPDRLRGALVSAILGDRRASLLYYGLCSMDEDTRGFFAATPSLVAQIYASSRRGPLALYGRSLRVRDGLVQVPGGAPGRQAWEALIGAPASQPEQFVLDVLGRDDGRLALLYDAIAQMDDDARIYALGTWIRDPARRVVALKALRDASAASLAGWEPEERPFSRPLYDPAHLLLMTPAGRGTGPAPPASARLWERAFAEADLPRRPAEELRHERVGSPIDAASAVETVCVTNASARRDRAEAWLFGHRVFAAAPDDAMPDVLVALRGHARYRVLADTLERLGVKDPAVYASAMRCAESLSAIGDRDRAAIAIGLFQGALVLVERARLARALDADAAGRLIRSLSAVEVSKDGGWDGAAAKWIDEAYLPAVSASGDDTSPDLAVLKAFAGRGARSGDGGGPRRVEIEGVTYQVDPSAPVMAHLLAVREKQGGWSLDIALAFARAVRSLAEVASLEQAKACIAALTTTAVSLRVHLPAGDVAAARALDDIDDVIEGLRKTRKPGDVKKARALASRLHAGADLCLSRVLASLAYAPHLRDPDGRELLAGDPSPRHDFGLLETSADLRAANPWRLPAESHEATGQWHLTGALLAMDVGLSQQALRRISTDTLPPPPALKANERQALAEAVVLANVYEYRADRLETVVGMLRRGRAHVASLVSAPDLLPDLVARASIDALRRQLIAWSLAHEPAAVPAFFSAGDLVALGATRPEDMEALSAWGTSGWSQEGCLCLQYPRVRLSSSLAGRQGKGLRSALLPDLTLLVADAIEQHRLPAELTLPVLATASQDAIDTVRPAHDDDWIGLAAQLQQLVAERVDDYVAAVMTGGVLVPLSDRTDEREH